MTGGGVKISLRVIPNASHNEVVGWRGSELTIKLTATPVKGRANRQLCGFLAEVFGVSPAEIALLRGQTSRRKTIHVAGLSAAEARECLRAHLD